MAQIKLRIEMNKGRKGAPLEKLGDVAKQIERFLRSLGGDLKLDAKKGEWLAEKFRNGSVSYDAAYQIEVPDAQLRHFNQCIEFITDYDPDTESPNGLVSDATLLEYGRIGSKIDPDEIISLGLYSGARNRLKWRRIEYRKLGRVQQAMESPLHSYGSVQGVLHSVVIDVSAPYFQIRELAGEGVIKCFYPRKLYDDIVSALKIPNAVVHASGDMRLDRARRTVVEMVVERLDKVEPLSVEEFQSFFGSAPGVTGEMTTDQFIREFRDG